MQLKLRDYQNESIQAIIAHINKGITRQLVVLPTGSGKTIVFCDLIKNHFSNSRVLILAHRDELIQQAKEKYDFIAGNSNNIGIMAGSDKDISKQITIASVQTLKNYLKADYFKPDAFDLIVCDEAHHATANSYLKIFNYFGVMNNKTILIGFTATPTRYDQRELGSLFTKIVYQKTILEMINHKPAYLCKPVGMAVNTNIDMSSVRTSMGDFRQNDLESCLDTPERNQAIIDIYKRLCPDDKAIIFCINKQHARNITDLFIKNKIKCGYIDANTSHKDRKLILKNFSKGKIKVLCNIAVLTEGFDEPGIQAVILARPTKSEALYVQMIGRGLRLHPDKQFCKIIDIVDNTGNHKIRTVGYILNKKVKNISISEIKSKSTKVDKLEPVNDWIEAEKFDEVQKKIEVKLQATSIFGNDRQFIWLGSGNHRFIEVGQVSNKIKVEISCQDDEQNLYQIFINGTPHLEKPCSFDWAFGIAEDYLNKNLGYREKILIDSKAGWRGQPITEKQSDLLYKQLKIPKHDLELIYKGEAAEIISGLINYTLIKNEAKKILEDLITERIQVKLLIA